MSDDIDNIQETVTNLRDRRGKTPLTKEERIQLLNECLDGSLFWLKQSVVSANTKGVGAATMIIERCRLEISELQRAGHNDTTNKQIIEIRWQESEPDDTEPKCDQPVGQTEAV